MKKIKLIILSALAIFNFNVCALAGAPVQITSFADIVEPLMPTVVNIYTVKHADQPEEQKAILPEILPVDKLSIILTNLILLLSKYWTIFEPMKPAPPVTKIDNCDNNMYFLMYYYLFMYFLLVFQFFLCE